MNNQFDIIISGGGLAGSLMASKLHRLHPQKSLLILEKETQLGGRLKSTNAQVGSWTYGLNGRSETLIDFINQELKEQGRTLGMAAFAKGQRQTLGVLAAGKITELPLDQSFSQQGAHAIAGAAAAREWSLVDECLSQVHNNPQKASHHFSQLWKGTRKGAAAIAIEHLCRLYGIPEIWGMRAADVLDRQQDFSQSQSIYDWECLCHELLKDGIAAGKITLQLQTEIGDASKKSESDDWQISTTHGAFAADRLVVTQNPWDALRWLPKNYWPPALLAIPVKTKPISAVLLSEKISSYSSLPDIVLVPAEGVQIYLDRDSLCVQATLNYESTLVAPEVVKAIRRLKRAHKKLLASQQDLQTTGEHIALRPVAWSTPLAPGERRNLSKLTAKKWQHQQLSFCGDSYGPDIQGDRNMVSSLISATQAFTD